jgi:drug/metabolite transporter (DMT)-like permease
VKPRPADRGLTFTLKRIVQRKLYSIILILTATFLFAVMDTFSKYLTAYFAVPLIVWARYAVHLIFMLVGIAPGMGREIVVTKHPWLMTFRGLLLASSSLLVVFAFRTLPLAETTALVFSTPLIVVLIAGPLLGEKVRLQGWLATIAGFGGVLLIARPGGSTFGIGVVYALGCALCYAGYQILTRKLSVTEPSMRQLFYTALVGTIAMSCFVPASWTGEVPTPGQGLIIASLGFFGGIGHFLLIRAFRETMASALSPLLYVQLIWATLLGWIFFGHLADPLTTVGMLIIGGSSLGLALRWPVRAKPGPISGRRDPVS